MPVIRAALLCLLWLVVRPGLADIKCPDGLVDARARVDYVFDGDTLALMDGRHLRFIGVDTPEIGRKGKPSQPLAEQARQRLMALLEGSPRIGLRYGRERKDRYGRTLAHVFLSDGRNVERLLLEEGLGTALVVPPNLGFVACYARVERAARDGRRGIWSLARYQPVEADGLSPDARGFHIVRGRVQRVGEGRSNLWLNLARNMAVRIGKTDLEYFRGYDPRQLTGRRLEARGWLEYRHGELRMHVRHPAALTLLD